jgi:protein CrcB
MKYLAVAGGGAAGAVLRYYMTGSALARAAAPFPTATFVINVTGSFVIGFFLTLAGERVPINPNVRLAVAVGFVGAYTTFSTFEYETARLVEGKDYLYAFLNVVLSFAVGFAAVWAGIVAARRAEGVSFARMDSETTSAVELAPALKLTVSVGGDERRAHRPLFREVLKVLHECGVGGATLTKGVLSFGAGRRVHSDMNEVTMENLPVIVEAVGERERVEEAAARVAELLEGHGLVQLQPTMVARPARKKEEGGGV